MIMSAACYGFMAIFVKFAYAGQANLATVLSGRFVLASLLLWLLVLVRRQAAGISPGELGSLFLLSLVGYGISSTLFFASLLFIPASLASMILFIHPVMVSLYELAVYRYPLSLKKVSALALSTAGLIFVLGNVGSGVNMRGVFLALGAALAYTVYLLYGKKVVGRHSPVVVTAYVLSFAAVGFTACGLASGGINPGLPAATWLWILAVAVISTCLGILFLFAGLKRLEAGRASIISTLEVVVTVCFSALLLGESMTVLQAAGGAMILAGIIILRIEPGREQMPG
ncbi:MAG: DMT family transporter [Actinobacteria bacterium]|nr:DMT family transporter [Actinomycetota bacterium]